MKRIRWLPFFILSVFLGGSGFSASLAMEEGLGDRPVSHGAAEVPSEEFPHERRLLETLHSHIKGSPLSHANLFFVPYSSEPIRPFGDELSIHAKASQTKITDIKIYPAQGGDAPPSPENRPKIEQDSRSFLETLQRHRPTFSLNLENPSFKPDCDLAFSPSSPLEITHLFALREKEKERSLESFLSEPKCSVTQKLTTIKGKSLAGPDVEIFLDTTFSMPIHTAINGFFYVTVPSLRSIFIVFLVQLPFSQTPQFVMTPHSKIEDTLSISSLDNWIFVEKILTREEETGESLTEDPEHEAAAAMAPPAPPSSHAADEAPIMPKKKHYFQVRYFSAHALPSYNKDWWKNWVSSPEEIFRNKSLKAFLGFFIEKLMRSDSRSKGSLIGTLRGAMGDGFHEVLSREPLQANQVNVEASHEPTVFPKLTNVTMDKLVLRQEKTSHVTTVVGHAKGPITLEPLNMLPPENLIPGVYNILDSEDPLSMKWHHEDEQGPPLVLQREKADKPSALKVSYTAESGIPFSHLLQAARLPWVTHLCVENTDLLRADPSLEIFTLGHLSSLNLRNCGLENAPSEFFTQFTHLRHLKTLDFSQNPLMPELFFQFLTILRTSSLPPNASLSLENLVLTLPPKPSPARKRALVGMLLTGTAATAGTAAAAFIFATPVGWIVGAGIAAGAATGGGVGGAVSQKAAALVKQGSLSHWTLTCLTPLLPIPSLKNVTAFNIPRNQNGCEKTAAELNKLRQQTSLPEISFSLHPKKMPPRREGAAGDEEWDDWQEVEEAQ